MAAANTDAVSPAPAPAPAAAPPPWACQQCVPGRPLHSELACTFEQGCQVRLHGFTARHCVPHVPSPPPPLPARRPAVQASTIKAVMAAPLPRRYEETAAAVGGATSGSSVGGDSFSGDAVMRAMQVGWARRCCELGGAGIHTLSSIACPPGAGNAAMPCRPQGARRHSWHRLCLPCQILQSAQHKIETEVLAPLHRWQEVFTQLGVRAWLWPPGAPARTQQCGLPRPGAPLEWHLNVAVGCCGSTSQSHPA